MANPYFTIIIAVYNAEKYLRATLDSIAAQTCKDWECVCVDDGSKDSSPWILDEYATRDPRFVIIHKENGGVGRARNAALDMAKGAWITWADADDILAPSRLAAAKRILDKENPDFLHLWFTMAKEMPKDFMSIGEECPYTTLVDRAEIYECAYRDIHPFSMLWLSFARRELYDGLRYPVGMRVKGDSILYATLFPRIRKLCRGTHAGYFYCLTDGSILRSKRKPSDCIRYQTEIASVWHDQIELACELGEDVVKAMSSDIRYASETDLTDWLVGHGKVSREEKRSVRSAHLLVVRSGAYRAKSRMEALYRPGLIVYRATGCDFLVRFAESAYNIIHRIR